MGEEGFRAETTQGGGTVVYFDPELFGPGPFEALLLDGSLLRPDLIRHQVGRLHFRDKHLPEGTWIIYQGKQVWRIGSEQGSEE